MRWIADLLYLLAGIMYLPVLLYQALVLGKNRRGWSERFGFIRPFDAATPRIWVHAVSLGEVNCTPRLVEALRERLPECDIVISTTTDTGYARAVQLYGQERVFRFPLDFSPVVARALRRVNPALIVLVELEVWYNLIRQATRRRVPVTVVNGRLTERSMGRLQRLGRFARTMFEGLAWVGAQDSTIAGRFQALGVPEERVEITSSLKWDTAAVADRIDGAEELAGSLDIPRDRPLWVCGSTGPGEEALILSAYRQVMQDWPTLAQSVHGESEKGRGFGLPMLAIVPRKPERFDEVADLIGRLGFSVVRRSECDGGAPGTRTPESTVFLGDTMGELRKFYSLADVIFVGRSLVPMGGSDPMEVAALGKPIIVGPHMENFQLPVEALAGADAIRVIASPEALPATVEGILTDPALASGLGARAQDVVVRHQGATGRTADAIVRMLASN